MKSEIRYYSKTGHTKKVAEAIGYAINIEALDISVPITEQVDILFLGSAVYAFGLDDNFKQFIDSLSLDKVKSVAIFSTSALVKNGNDKIEKLLIAKGIKVLKKQFHCYGNFKALKKGHPSDDDLKKAADFAVDIIK